MKTSFTIIVLFFVLTFKGFSQENILTSLNEKISISELKKPYNLFATTDKLPLSMTRNFWGTRKFYEGNNEISNQEFSQKLTLNQDTRDLLYKSNKEVQYGNIATGVAIVALIGSYATTPKDSRYMSAYSGKPGWVIAHFTSVIVGAFWHIKGQGNLKTALSFYNERYASNAPFNSNINGLSLSYNF
jgi:hypothetical protein